MQIPHLHAFPPTSNVETNPQRQRVVATTSVDGSPTSTAEDNSRNAPPPQLPQDEVLFRVEKERDRLVVSVFDDQGALVRRIPAEVVLQMARRLERVIADRSLGLHAEA